MLTSCATEKMNLRYAKITEEIPNDFNYIEQLEYLTKKKKEYSICKQSLGTESKSLTDIADKLIPIECSYNLNDQFIVKIDELIQTLNKNKETISMVNILLK